MASWLLVSQVLSLECHTLEEILCLLRWRRRKTQATLALPTVAVDAVENAFIMKAFERSPRTAFIPE